MQRPIRLVKTESAEDYLWNRLFILENEQSARDFLRDKYAMLSEEKAEWKAYQNVSKLVNYIRQAKACFQSEIQSSLQPILLYYGMMNLCKAWILTFAPDYPQNTSVLRHGLSTWKRKKSHYQFLKDEVRVQKDGLFPLILEQFPQTSIGAGNLFLMRDLLTMMPDLLDTIEIPELWPIKIGPTTEQGMSFSISESILDCLHIPPTSLVERFNRTGQGPVFQFDQHKSHSGRIILTWHHLDVHHVDDWNQGFAHPWFYETRKGDYYLWVGNDRLSEPVPELLAQYMILFNLSMLCRYDPPLWGEVLDGFTSDDMLYIHPLLPLVKRKFPNLMVNLLFEEKVIIQVH